MRLRLNWTLSLALVLVIILTACQPAVPAAAPQETAPQQPATPAAEKTAPAAQKPAEQESTPQQAASQAPAVEEAAPSSVVSYPTAPAPGKIRKEGPLLISEKGRLAATDVDPQDRQTLADDNIDFLLDLYPRIQPKDKNFFFSPYSISIAMAMVFGGARGETANQIADVMHFSLPPEKLHPAFNAISTELLQHTGQENGPKINVANSIWGQANRPFQAEYLDLLAEDYGAGLFTLDFTAQPEEARKQINDWVGQQTEEKIPEIIPEGALTPLTRMILVDAIYFKSAWESPFDPALSDRGYFFFVPNGQTMIETMSQTGEYAYAKSDKYEAIEIPYAGGGLSMIIIMPKVEEFLNIEKDMNKDFIKKVEGELKPQQVALTMPRFKLESSFSLAEPLIKMGILNAFASLGANFSGIDGTRDLFLEEISHKAYINVDEAGTEAAAASAVGVKDDRYRSRTGVDEHQPPLPLLHPRPPDERDPLLRADSQSLREGSG